MKLQIFMKKISKVDSNYTCLAVISLDSAPRKYENNYPQDFLKNVNMLRKKVVRHINDNMSDFTSFDESDEKYIGISQACVSKGIEHYFSNRECMQKKQDVFLNLCLQCIKIH